MAMSRSTRLPPQSEPHPSQRRGAPQSRIGGSGAAGAAGAAAGPATATATGGIKGALETGLWLVATPIGNLADMTDRARTVLDGADLILAEDTRVTRKLMAAFGIKGRVERCDETATPQAARLALAVLAEGGAVAFASDAGTPGVSDPGVRLARAVIEAGHAVRPVPGASALLAALVISGLPTERFVFAGFAPPKAGARTAFLADLAALPMTVVLFETGPRLEACLEDLVRLFGADRPACLARELTKVYEEAWRAPLASLLERVRTDGAPRGEIVLLVGPAPARAPGEGVDVDSLLREALACGSTKEAARIVAARTGLPRADLYARALALR
jgi:16S rRNA (cytidine1402-2'-O)-methyltransferase